MTPRFDVLGLGCTAVDDLLYVEAYPRADAKARVLRRERQCGGLTSTALVAAARLGARCAFAGTLGEDDDSRFVLETLRREGVDRRHVVRRDGARPVRSMIVVDERRGTRNIFYTTNGVMGADARTPPREFIAASRVLLVDRFGMKGMIRAARLARAAGVAVVADMESSDVPGFATLLALADHLILSADFACRITRAKKPAAAVRKLWRRDRAVVIATEGARGGWWLDATVDGPRRYAAFRVKAADTTGCGDVFHGAYAAALARGESLLERIRFAAAAAALKATKPGGQAGIPSRSELESFLRRAR